MFALLLPPSINEAAISTGKYDVDCFPRQNVGKTGWFPFLSRVRDMLYMCVCVPVGPRSLIIRVSSRDPRARVGAVLRAHNETRINVFAHADTREARICTRENARRA